MKMIQELDKWTKKGLVELVGGSYNMDSPFEDIEDEYENALDNKRKADSINMQSNILLGCVGFIENTNKLNPFAETELENYQSEAK